jgi:hypothetical protein
VFIGLNLLRQPERAKELIMGDERSVETTETSTTESPIGTTTKEETTTKETRDDG